MISDKAQEVQRQVQALLDAGFINEVMYPTWLSNMVMVKKSNGKWRICIDCTDLNKACPKDSFPLPSTDELVDATSGFRFLSFLDAYSRYNQIPMHPSDEEKTAFISPMDTYCYKVMPFGLKNIGATYQRLMNKVFAKHIGTLMEVYIDNMLVKIKAKDELLSNLETMFECLRRHRMRLNPQKCVFAIEAWKFLGFMLTHQGIEVNPDKYQAILKMKNTTSVKDVQCLTRRITSLSRFLAASAQKASPFFTLLKKEILVDDGVRSRLPRIQKLFVKPSDLMQT